MKKHSLPKFVRIGCFRYALSFKDRVENDQGRPLLGCIDYNKTTIEVSNLIRNNPQQVMETIWHEAIHGIIHNAHIREQVCDSEPAVQNLSQGVMRLIQDNPWMAKV